MKYCFLAMSIVAMPIEVLSGHASAQGFVGGLIDQVAPGVGTALDQANKNAGKPFDHAVAAGMNIALPGSGTVLEGYWTAQDIIAAIHDGRISGGDVQGAIQVLSSMGVSYSQ